MDERCELANAIIMRIAQGDLTALDDLYKEFGGLLFSMAKKYLCDVSYAEDLLSDVLVKLVRTAKSFNPRKNGLNWLFATIRNEAFDHNKRSSRAKGQSIDERQDLCAVMGFEDSLIDGAALKSALSQLNETQRSLLYLKYWEGLTIREIAKKTKKPRSTAQDMINTALRRLSDMLGE